MGGRNEGTLSIHYLLVPCLGYIRKTERRRGRYIGKERERKRDNRKGDRRSGRGETGRGGERRGEQVTIKSNRKRRHRKRGGEK